MSQDFNYLFCHAIYCFGIPWFSQILSHPGALVVALGAVNRLVALMTARLTSDAQEARDVQNWINQLERHRTHLLGRQVCSPLATEFGALEGGCVSAGHFWARRIRLSSSSSNGLGPRYSPAGPWSLDKQVVVEMYVCSGTNPVGATAGCCFLFGLSQRRGWMPKTSPRQAYAPAST